MAANPSARRPARIAGARRLAGWRAFEVQAPKQDAGLIRALAEALRNEPEKAATLRAALVKSLMNPEVKNAFDVFGSDLSDDAFAGIFDQPRQRHWRRVDL